MRYSSIDIMRTIAIVVMVFVHFTENLSGYYFPLAGFGAPMFAFLSGVSYRLWVNREQSRGIAEETISKVSIRRGLFVIGVGFVFNILVWLPEDTFNWDVLTFIGVALLVLNGARRLPLPVSGLAAAVILLISPVLRHQTDYSAYWLEGYFDLDWTLSDVLLGMTVNGYFPLFPWLSYSLAGLITGSVLFPSTAGRGSQPPSLRPIVQTGTTAAGVSILLLLARNLLPEIIRKPYFGGWTMFPPTVEYVLGTFGMTLLLLAALQRFVDRHPDRERFSAGLKITKTFSRYSFTIYVLHHIVHLWPLWIYTSIQGQETTALWRAALPVETSFLLAAVFLVLTYFLLRWLGPERTYGIESAMRWLCDEEAGKAQDG